MIRHLSINNLMLVDKIEMDIGLGLCVLTGETGAGKSMILESLELISGRRIKPNSRPDSGKKTVITALIDISDFEEIKELLTRQEINFEDEIIIKRIIESDGKSKAIINDNIVGLNTLKEISNYVIEVHSQFSEQGLLDNSTHITTLDEFGDYKIELKQLSKMWREYKETQKQYIDENTKSENIKNQIDEYTHDLKELKLLSPRKGEFSELEKKRKFLKNSRKIRENITHVIDNFLREEPPGIESLITKNIVILDQIKGLVDNETTKDIEKLNSISLEISEISKMFENFLSKENDGDSLEEIDDRVTSYKRIAQKHSINVDNLEIKINELERDIRLTEESKLSLENLAKELKVNQEKYNTMCEKVSTIRKRSAELLDKKINTEFPDLKLENAKFKTLIQECERTELGKDKVVFNIRTNPKSKMGEIRNISSGGELCRIALAIKVTAERNNSSTMVFDEVDSGIGGAVSTAVGERLRKLGEKRQVMVVTHSPQVASLGASHFLVKKRILENNIAIEVQKIEGEEKTTEIARMLSGKQITQEAIQAAKKLMENFF